MVTTKPDAPPAPAPAGPKRQNNTWKRELNLCAQTCFDTLMIPFVVCASICCRPCVKHVKEKDDKEKRAKARKRQKEKAAADASAATTAQPGAAEEAVAEPMPADL